MGDSSESLNGLMNNYDKNLQHHYGNYSSSWNTERVVSAILGDKYFSHDKEACKRACTRIINQLRFVRDADKTFSELALDYVGSYDLLKRSDKVSLICHRAEEQYFNFQRMAILDAAQEGSVVVSAFISPKEKEIKRLLIEQHLPFIEVLGFGITPDYHPFGRAYEACAAGMLTQISPWDYRMQAGHRLTREMCIAMNELVRVISNIPDEWWADRVM